MQPNNPIVGGITLRIPAIQSPDYVAGVSGWSIFIDGTAEFNNVTIRGTFITGTVPGAHVTITGGQILIFDSGNNLVGQLDSTGIEAIGSNGSLVRLHTVGSAAEIGVLPGGGNVNEAIIAGANGPSSTPQLVIESPQQTLTTPNTRASIVLQGANAVFGKALATMSADEVSITGLANGTGVGSAGLDVGGPGATVPGGANLFGGSGSAIGLDTGGPSIANNVTIATNSLSLIVNTIDDAATHRLYLLRALDNFDCSSTLTLTTTSTLITGCSHTYTSIPAGAKWSVIGTFDCGLGAVANTDIGELWVALNGGALAKQNGDASYNGGLNTRSGITRSWSGVFTAGGSIAFELHGRQGGAGGVNVMATPGTTMQVAIYQ